MATWKVLIAHAKGEEHLAETLAEPLREIGYEVAHLGTVFVGESVVEEASKTLSLGGPVVLCGTVRAVGTPWARRVVNAARRHSGVRVFVVQMEEEADVQSAAFDEVVARFWQDPAKAIADLQAALRRYYPLDEAGMRLQRGTTAEQRYRELLQKTCDIIDLANLPEQDRHIVHRQLELRRLYVPLRVWVEAEVGEESDEARWEALEQRRIARMRGRPEKDMSSEGVPREDVPRRERQRSPIGERLVHARRLVVLGDPGAGKTTLTRWIATAYLLRLRRDPDWGNLPDVKTLPDDDWLPILVRCRHLDEECLNGSLDDVLRHTLRKAELTEAEASALHETLRERLNAGTALLMLDGLDEIPDPGARARFCQQLQQIHRAYPKVPIIATSRTVGYREMGYQLGQEFEHVTLADLQREEKDDFARRWCALTELPERRATAEEELIHDIHSSDRIERLTGNPMLLTTLALVKRKVGKLPNRRADLYWEAVQVLLNWRSDVDKPLDPHEAVPQLAFLAYAMCDRGVQQLRRDEALELLAQMRREYPNLHLIHRQHPEAFLRQAEARTGILLEAGHMHHLGMTVPVYEFRHLTFQEYLAARALVDGYFPGRDPKLRLAEHVAPLAGRTAETAFTEEGEKEVAVVESWREALRLCTDICHNDDVDSILHAILTPLKGEPEAAVRARAIMAMLCLADEPNASDSVVHQILDAFARQVKEYDGEGTAAKTGADVAAMQVAGTRWANRLRSVLVEEFFCRDARSRRSVGALCGMVGAVSAPQGTDAIAPWLSQRASQLREGTEREAVGLALTIMELAYEERMGDVSGLADILINRLTGSAPMTLASAWALGWLNGGRPVRYGQPIWSPTPAQIERILAFIRNLTAESTAVHYLAWILANERVVAAVEPLLARLEDAEASVRSAAAEALGNIRSERAVEPLLARLEDTEASVRSAAAQALGNIGSERAVEPLLARLTDAEADVRRVAAYALGNIRSERAVEPLLVRLEDTEASMRSAAAWALGNIGSERAVEPLLARLEDTEASVRSAAAQALGNIRSERAVEPLLARLEDTEASVRSAAAEALGNIRSERAVEPLLARLEDTEASVRSAAAQALGNIGSERAVEPLLARLEDAEAFTRSVAAYALGNIRSERAVEPLLARLEDTEASMRSATAWALGNIGSERAVEPLLARLEDAEASMRSAAAQALGNIGNERAVEPLLARLEDTEASVRSAAAEVLGNIGSERAVEPLLARLEDAEASVRSAAAEALGNIGSERAVEPLLARLEDTEASVRSATAWALGNIRSERAVEPLIVRLEHAETDVRRAAAEALGNIYFDLNRYDDAVTFYQRACALDPKSAVSHYSLGTAYQMLGQLEIALSEYQTSVKLDPQRGMRRVSLAGALRKLGREAEAAEQIRIARRFMAGEGKYNHACFESICGNTIAALALLKVALEKKEVRREWARRDPDFDWIRDDPRFRALVE